MSENSPAPTTERGVYGFALYLSCTSAFVMFLVWAFIPDNILHSIGITYYPQKYWAIALPIYLLMCLSLFAFFLYPALNQLLCPPLDSINTFTDGHAHILPDPWQPATEKSGRVPPALDLDISSVCKSLYLR